MQVETSTIHSENLRVGRVGSSLLEGQNEAIDLFPAHENIFMMHMIVREEAGSEIIFSEGRQDGAKCLNKYGGATLKV